MVVCLHVCPLHPDSKWWKTFFLSCLSSFAWWALSRKAQIHSSVVTPPYVALLHNGTVQVISLSQTRCGLRIWWGKFFLVGISPRCHGCVNSVNSWCWSTWVMSNSILLPLHTVRGNLVLVHLEHVEWRETFDMTENRRYTLSVSGCSHAWAVLISPPVSISAWPPTERSEEKQCSRNQKRRENN